MCPFDGCNACLFSGDDGTSCCCDCFFDLSAFLSAVSAFFLVGFVAAVAAAAFFCGGGSDGGSCGCDSAFALLDRPVLMFWQALLQW